VITAYYHASSGGRTAAVQDVWPDRTPVPYLVSVADPFDAISPYHRWGPFLQSPESLGKRLGTARLADVLVDRSASGFVERVRVVAAAGARVLGAREFADALGLRSTAFAVRVLALEPPTRRVLDDRPLALGGFVRGLGGVELQERSTTGAWRTVSRVHPEPNGRFQAKIVPRRTTRYRLTVEGLAGPEVTVRVAPAS
jgi:SpoIID/LytB domain protein